MRLVRLDVRVLGEAETHDAAEEAHVVKVVTGEFCVVLVFKLDIEGLLVLLDKNELNVSEVAEQVVDMDGSDQVDVLDVLGEQDVAPLA